ncbi:MAG: glycogen debranching enzyme, partial [Chromatiaceae bacterium]|nr:glycogen debranching enzyme [Chromatiaceae bacterium]
RRQARNLLTLLFLSQGVPMLLAGDEVLRTQHGNNNVWCQDNALGWFDWRLVERNSAMLRFTRELIALRQRHPSLRRRHFLTGRARAGSDWPDVRWFGPELEEPDWEDPENRALAFTLAPVQPSEATLHVAINMSLKAVCFALPQRTGLHWYRALDTARAAPADCIPPAQQMPLAETRLLLRASSILVLEGRPQRPVSHALAATGTDMDL